MSSRADSNTSPNDSPNDHNSKADEAPIQNSLFQPHTPPVKSPDLLLFGAAEELAPPTAGARTQGEESTSDGSILPEESSVIEPNQIDPTNDSETGDRADKRNTLLRVRRRNQLMRAAVVGLVAGLVAVGFQLSLYEVEEFRNYVLRWLREFPSWGWVVLPIVGAAMAGSAGYITSKYAPEAGGSGIPHIKAVLLHLRNLEWGRVIGVKFSAGLLSIGAGLSLGREGPTVQMGAGVGKAISEFFQLPRRSQNHLIACGAGAGLAAAFNAPLAGFIFVIEELRRELSSLTYGTAFVASVVAVAVSRTFTGQLPSFTIRNYATPSLTALPLFALVGLLAGYLGVFFNRSLVWALKFFQRQPQAVWKKAAIMGAVAGLVLWWMPEAAGAGHRTAEMILRGDYAGSGFIQFMVLLFIVKFGLTIFSYSTGVPGGIFAPLLVLGALIGLIVGQASGIWFPELARTPAAFAVVGMAAYFTAIVRAPLTGIVLILEMTANHQQLYALLVACLGAYVVAEHLQDMPIYEKLLELDLSRKEKNAISHDEPAVIDLFVEPESRMSGRRVMDVGLPFGCLLVTVERSGQEFVPVGESRLRAGDHITAVIAGPNTRTIAQVQTLAKRPTLH